MKWMPSSLKLVEMAHIGPEFVGNRALAPMQLFRMGGKSAESDHRIFVVSGFQGPSKNDVHVSGLLQKALDRGLFAPLSDLWLTPVVNPSADPRTCWNNHSGTNLRDMMAEGFESPEQALLKQWILKARPKAVLCLSAGTPGGNTLGVIPSVSQKLADVMEHPVHDLETNAEASALKAFPKWCQSEGILWVEITIDDSKKTFDEVRELDWRKNIGPAVKWLLEADRFDPPKEEPINLDHMIVPALEMPPEFAHL